MSRVRLPLEGAMSILANSTKSEESTSTSIIAKSGIITEVVILGKSGAPFSNIGLPSPTEMVTAFPSGVFTSFTKKPSSLKWITEVEISDETNVADASTACCERIGFHSPARDARQIRIKKAKRVCFILV